MENRVDIAKGKLGESDRPLVEALCILANSLGKTINEGDLLMGLPAFDGDLPECFISRALATVGLVCRIETSAGFDLKTFPVCIGFSDGRFITVLGKDEENYIVAAPFAAAAVQSYNEKTIKQLFSGFKIEAFPSLEDIYQRHVGEGVQGHWFWGWFYNQKRNVFDIILGTFVANILSVAVSLFALQVYDRVIPNQSETTLWVLAVGVSIAIIMEGIMRITRARIIDIVGRRIELEISSFLFEKLAWMRLSSRPASPGSLVYMVKEFGSVREFFTASSIGAVADIPFVFVFLVLIYAIAGNVVWIIVAAAIAMIFPSLLTQGTMARLSSEMLGGTAAAGKLLTEMCYGQETVKAAVGERFFQRKWEEINILNAAKTTEQRALSVSLIYWAASIQQFAYVSAVVAGVYYVFAGEFTIGTIIATSILTGRTLAPITQLSGTLARWQQVKASLAGLEQIVTSEQERPKGRAFARRSVLKGDFKLEGVKYHYAEDAPASLSVDHWNIVNKNIVGILGPNGSGKSTLLKVMSGLYSIREGNMTIDGLDYRQLDPLDARKNIGYLPQDIKLFNGTLRENLILGKSGKSDDRLFESLSFSGLDDYVKKNPNGLDLPIHDGGEGLSVGQRQSIGLARLYLQDPAIVLLDEPTASMDHALENWFVNQLEHWLSGKTCIIATHRMPILRLVGRLCVLQNGIIIMDGDKETVLKKITKPITKEKRP